MKINRHEYRALNRRSFFVPRLGVIGMTFIEELASMVVRIQNLRERIECSEEPDMALEEQAELRWLMTKLDRMKGGRGSRIVRVRATIDVALTKGGVSCYM